MVQKATLMKPLSALTLPLLLISVGLNAAQAAKIRGLTEPATQMPAIIGQTAPVLTGIDGAGRAQTFAFSGELPTLVYFFSPTCDWCERNWDNVAALAQHGTGNYRFVAITQAKELGGFAKDRGLSLDILSEISPEVVRAFHFGGTPSTLVVSSQGIITNAWIGGFDGRLKTDIETFFDVKLPGLRPVHERSQPLP